jgi:hypothetical protein
MKEGKSEPDPRESLRRIAGVGVQSVLGAVLSGVVANTWLHLNRRLAGEPGLFPLEEHLRAGGIPALVMAGFFLGILVYSLVAMLRPFPAEFRRSGSTPDDRLRAGGTFAFLLGTAMTLLGLAELWRAAALRGIGPGSAFFLEWCGIAYPGVMAPMLIAIPCFLLSGSGALILGTLHRTTTRRKAYAFPGREALVFLGIVGFWVLHALMHYPMLTGGMEPGPFLFISDGIVEKIPAGRSWEGFLSQWAWWPWAVLVGVGLLTAGAMSLRATARVAPERKWKGMEDLPRHAGYLFGACAFFLAAWDAVVTFLRPGGFPPQPLDCLWTLFPARLYWIAGFGTLAAALGLAGSGLARAVPLGRRSGRPRKDGEGGRAWTRRIPSLVYALFGAFFLFVLLFAGTRKPEPRWRKILELPRVPETRTEAIFIEKHVLPVLFIGAGGEIRLRDWSDGTVVSRDLSDAVDRFLSGGKDRLHIRIAADRRGQVGLVKRALRLTAKNYQRIRGTKAMVSYLLAACPEMKRRSISFSGLHGYAYPFDAVSRDSWEKECLLLLVCRDGEDLAYSLLPPARAEGADAFPSLRKVRDFQKLLDFAAERAARSPGDGSRDPLSEKAVFLIRVEDTLLVEDVVGVLGAFTLRGIDWGLDLTVWPDPAAGGGGGGGK